MALRRMGSGSMRTGRLPRGCEHCREGSKMVLLVSGRCAESCYYCPLSHERKGRDVIYADESRVERDEEVIAEAESIGASGTGITGGDPLLSYERTLRMIRLLKGHFGEGHHIHLYTATLDPVKVKGLEEAGLDEIRFHPPLETWEDLAETALPQIVRETGMDVGLELPALPDQEGPLRKAMRDAFAMGVSFVNLNELEFSEGNWGMMDSRGYGLKDDLSAAVKGSERMARRLLREFRRHRVHYCSSRSKDSVQLRRRLLRRAERVAQPWEVVTRDGTLLKGLVLTEEPEALLERLRREEDVPEDLMRASPGRLELAPWVLEELAPSLGEPCFLVEEHPGGDRLEVERAPLN